MASVYNYNFDNRTRIGNDTCSITAREAQNNEMGSYNTTNYFLKECGMKKPIAFATQQPSMFYNGGFGPCGAGGCNITSDSKLKIGTIQTHPKCKISLQQRPFSTVPYLGRGPARPVLEARLQQGAMINDTKSCKTITETSFGKYTSTPLLPTLQATIQNPHNLVEGVAANGWLRGGLPSRELTRDQDYIERHTQSMQ
jgi:hypothetical protein